jgi:hypothetical protein
MSNQTHLQQLFDLIFNFCLVLGRIVVWCGIVRDNIWQQWYIMIIASMRWQMLRVLEYVSILRSCNSLVWGVSGGSLVALVLVGLSTIT